jgi:glyoxylase-like metal-dependent hydrolase (beta-lactamase superfamily II)
MFGVVPKTIWNKLNPADENNLCNWAMRCLLIQDGNRLVLVDTGCGNKQDAKFFAHYFLHGNDSLKNSLNQLGFTEDDITDVILTHLHFDHVGGATQWNSDKSAALSTFKNATYWSTKSHWQWATNPNPREKPSFMKENFMPIMNSGQLKFIENDSDFGNENFSFLKVNGHTESMLVPKIKYKKTTVCFMADLIPSVGHLALPYIASYDIRPLDAMHEKSTFLTEALENNYTLFFEHDPINEMTTLKMTEKGIKSSETGKLIDL